MYQTTTREMEAGKSYLPDCWLRRDGMILFACQVSIVLPTHFPGCCGNNKLKFFKAVL